MSPPLQPPNVGFPHAHHRSDASATIQLHSDTVRNAGITCHGGTAPSPKTVPIQMSVTSSRHGGYPHLGVSRSCKAGGPTPPSAGLIVRWEFHVGSRNSGNVYFAFLVCYTVKDVVRDTGEQPDEEAHRARSGRALNPGASVPMEMGFITSLPGSRTCSPTPKLSKPYSLRVVREVSSLRHDHSLLQVAFPLQEMVRMF